MSWQVRPTYSTGGPWAKFSLITTSCRPFDPLVSRLISPFINFISKNTQNTNVPREKEWNNIIHVSIFDLEYTDTKWNKWNTMDYKQWSSCVLCHKQSGTCFTTLFLCRGSLTSWQTHYIWTYNQVLSHCYNRHVGLVQRWRWFC